MRRQEEIPLPKRCRWLYHWCGADVDSGLGHVVVVASRGSRSFAHLDKSEGSSMADSLRILPCLHVNDDVSEICHCVLYRLVQDTSVKCGNADRFRETRSILQNLSVLEDLLRFDHEKEGCQRVHDSHRL